MLIVSFCSVSSKLSPCARYICNCYPWPWRWHGLHSPTTPEWYWLQQLMEAQGIIVQRWVVQPEPSTIPPTNQPTTLHIVAGSRDYYVLIISFGACLSTCVNAVKTIECKRNWSVDLSKTSCKCHLSYPLKQWRTGWLVLVEWAGQKMTQPEVRWWKEMVANKDCISMLHIPNSDARILCY